MSVQTEIISTHAPAGGATREDFTMEKYTIISTHAPAGGATRARWQTTARLQNFYSRPCGRGDTEVKLRDANAYTISTHAPAGGATMWPKSPATLRNKFLLTPLREGRPGAGGNGAAQEDHFYSRPCGRGDTVTRCRLILYIHFYSRPCGRGDAGRDEGRV